MQKNNEILMIHEDFLDTYQTAMVRAEAMQMSAHTEDRHPEYQPYEVRAGVLYIPVTGMLLNKWNVTLEGMLTSYDYITEAFAQGMSDPQVSSVVLDINSPGGMVQGAFEAVALMLAVKHKKVVARTKGYATSAAYMMALVADEIIAQESAVVGSIGAIVIHQSYERSLENDGVQVTVIKSGDRKMEGNPYEALSADARERIQKSINQIGEKFAQLTASRRPGLTKESVMAFEAAAFPAIEGKELGLVDKISLVNDRINMYSETNDKKEQPQMTESVDNTKVDLEKIQQAAAQASQVRIQAILDAPEAEGRETLAKTVAFTTGLTVEQAIGLLKAAPKAESKASFEQLMLNTPNPEVGAGKEISAAAPVAMDWSKILFDKKGE